MKVIYWLYLIVGSITILRYLFYEMPSINILVSLIMIIIGAKGIFSEE